MITNTVIQISGLEKIYAFPLTAIANNTINENTVAAHMVGKAMRNRIVNWEETLSINFSFCCFFIAINALRQHNAYFI